MNSSDKKEAITVTAIMIAAISILLNIVLMVTWIGARDAVVNTCQEVSQSVSIGFNEYLPACGGYA